MKSLKILLIGPVVAGVFLCSCTMENRQYASGFDIQWKYKADKQVPANTPSPMTISRRSVLKAMLRESISNDLTPIKGNYSTMDPFGKNTSKSQNKDPRKSATVQLWQDIGGN